MQLKAGDKLGPYEITALIGKGGMGEVYQGTDTRLGRPVAIKVSAREFSDRFEREARAISSLNHPHVCTLYDVGPNYLVMEFVEGDTLSKVVAQGPIPLDKALRYAVQITDALAAAHAKGVIHRDLKPGNIIVTSNGVKVLDFGLAKLGSDKIKSDSGSTDVATMTEPITGAGAVLGTLHYMSPEQVEGKDTDQRSDIFSMGVVLYEMITGRRAFSGDTQAAILAGILKDQPAPMNQWQPSTPRSLERVVRKCLEKKPDDRWQSARDLKPTLELIDLDGPTSASSSVSQAAIPVPTRPRRWLWPAVAGIAILAIAVAGYTFWPNSQPSGRVTRFESTLPEGVEITPNSLYVRVSPDGSKLAFTTAGPKGGVWVRDLEAVQARLLPGTENAIAMFWSPDNKSVGYANGHRLMRVEIAGGPPQVLCEVPFNVGSGIWTPDNQIVFGGRGQGALQRVSAAGGIPEPLTVVGEGESFHSQPSLLPDNRHFLYLRTGGDKTGIYSGSLDNKADQQPSEKVMPVAFGATFVRAGNSSGGDLFFVRDGTLMAQPFDPKAMHLTGDPIPVVQQIGTGTAHAHFSVTSGGVMAYRTGPGNKFQITWVDQKGNIVEKVGEPGVNASISLSPDEKQLAIYRNPTGTTGGGDIWLLDRARNVESRLTTGEAVSIRAVHGPVWSPDGKQLAYVSGSRILVKDIGGATDAKLVKDLGHAADVTDWTRDGRFLIYDEPDPKGGGDIRAIAVAGGDPAPVVATDASEIRARVSPDGRWVAYDSSRSGSNEVYVRPFAAPGSSGVPSGPVIQISRDGGSAPKWSGDGRELFFRSAAGGMMSATIEASKDTFRPAAPIAIGIPNADQGWAVSKDGKRYLISQPLDRGRQTPITVVTNWEAALKR